MNRIFERILSVKKEIAANGIKFKERDISKLCNCQAHDVWLMQRIEYLAACKKWGKDVLDSFYVTGEPIPPE